VTAYPHLHVRSQYSPLRGLCRVKDLVKSQAGSVACITDTGGLWAATKLQRACEAISDGNSVTKPIFGCELSLAECGPMVFLAVDSNGWRSLCDLSSRSLSGQSATLEYAASLPGLHVLSGGADGDLYGILLRSGIDSVRQRVRQMSCFAEYAVEISPTMPRWRDLARVAGECGVDVVATGDVSYMRPDGEADLRLLRSIAGKTKYDGASVSGEGYLRTHEEMLVFFAECPESLVNAKWIADRCNVLLDLGKPRLPRFAEGERELLRSMAREGLQRRLRTISGDHSRYWQRLDYELDVIARMDFEGYFLIVSDFIRDAKARGIGVGPGRGSAAGSCAVWALGITDLDPLHYGLLFERFLNPERLGGLPDIDVDICTRGRASTVAYLQSRYGVDSVAKLTTFKILHGKTALKDCGRAFGIGFNRLNELTANVPPLVAGKAPGIAWIVANDPRLANLMEEDRRVRLAVQYAGRIEGLVRETGVHASGIVISEGPLWHTTPVARDKRRELVSQYDMGSAEDAGLVKFDLLGLNNVTQLQMAAGSAGIDLATIPLDDAAVYANVASGDTHGVFQMGKGGFRRMIRAMKPDRFEDIIAAGALYRPGPLESGMTKSYIERKHGRETIESLHPALDSILSDTYACVVYQEMVMSMVRILAGYSLGRADIVRKIMGKKKREMLEKEESVFLQAAAAHGVCDDATARKAWAVVVANAGYSFNRSHSAAYGLISYHTAYIKTHYAAHFYAALLSVAADESEKGKRIAQTFDDMRRHGITLLPPVVGRSRKDFTVETLTTGSLAVRYGLAGIRSLGAKTIDRLLALPPRTLDDLFSLAIGKRDLRALAYSGALDHLLPRGAEDREAVLSVTLPKPQAAPKTPKAVAKRKRQDSQMALFAAPQKPSITLPYREPSDDDVPKRLAAERKYTGIYLSGHPLNAFAEGRSLRARPDKRDTIMIPVLLDRVFERRTKKGEWMAILFVQDRTRCEEIPCFPKSYAKLADSLELAVGKTVLLDCGATEEGKLHAQRLIPLGWKLPIIEDNGTMLSDFIVLDLETTGRDDDDRSPGTQRIVEIGISEFVCRSHTRNYSRLINPTIGISEGSRKIHGISDDMVAGQPTFAATAPRLADYLRNRVIVTYNGTRFDIPVLQAEFARAGVPMPPMVPIDLYRHARNRYDKTIRPASKQLGDQCLFFDVVLTKAHRAADDAEATGRLLIAMQDRGLAPKGIDSLAGV